MLNNGTERQSIGERMREMYNGGHGIASIMAITGKPYIEVLENLRKAKTNLITGGPHDLKECEYRHNHKIVTYRTWLLEYPTVDLELRAVPTPAR